MKTSLLMVALVLACLVAATPVGAQSPTPVGVWLHANGRIQVAIAPCNDRLCGKIVWFRWPNDASGRPLVDFKNPDPALRTRPLFSQFSRVFAAPASAHGRMVKSTILTTARTIKR